MKPPGLREKLARLLAGKLLCFKKVSGVVPVQAGQKLQTAAPSSATNRRHDARQRANRDAGLPQHFMLIEPTEPPVQPETALSEADPLFNYENALQACSRGDSAALQNLYKQEGRHLLGVAMRIVRQRQQAEDVVHDAFMNNWTKAGSFDAQLASGRG